jgi:hypothetical protein
MKVEVFGRVDAFGQIQRGSLVRLALNKIEYLGMKVGRENIDRLLALEPDLPGFSGRPALVTCESDLPRLRGGRC